MNERYVSKAWPASRPSTLNDVARRAGVSTATVSRCLNKPESVRKQTRMRVLRAIEALGYTPHFGGKALALNRTNTIGAVIPTMENAIFARALQALEEALGESGVTLLVATSHYRPDRELAQIRTLYARGVDGLFLIGQARPDETYALLQGRGVPFVLGWTCGRDPAYGAFALSREADLLCRCVGFDNRSAARAMGARVLEMGHRRIAMIAGRTAWNDRARARIDGVSDALAGAGVVLGPDHVVEAAYTLEAGEHAFCQLMDLPRRPSAVICGNDVLAAGALRGARRLALNVPGDVSVVGFDDIDLAEAVEPALTTVHVPHRQMGWAAGHTLLALRKGEVPEPGVSRVLHTYIVERATLAACP